MGCLMSLPDTQCVRISRAAHDEAVRTFTEDAYLVLRQDGTGCEVLRPPDDFDDRDVGALNVLRTWGTAIHVLGLPALYPFGVSCGFSLCTSDDRATQLCSGCQVVHCAC